MEQEIKERLCAVLNFDFAGIKQIIFYFNMLIIIFKKLDLVWVRDNHDTLLGAMSTEMTDLMRYKKLAFKENFLKNIFGHTMQLMGS